jgi:hypothetical protein
MPRRNRPDRSRPFPISLGDRIRIEEDLRPADTATRDVIDRLLGGEPPSAAASTTSLGPWKPAASSSAATPTAPVTAAPVADAASRHDPLKLAGIETTSTPLGRIALPPPAWSGNVAPLDPGAGGEESLAPPPIFSVAHTRALLTGVLSTLHDGSEIDTARASAQLTRDFHLRSIPYRPVASLRRGAQVLVDLSGAMAPFRDDVAQVLADLEHLFGRGHLEVLNFKSSPASGPRRGVWAQDSGGRRAWRSPGRGVPVLVISDVTMSPSMDDDVATVDEWQRFAHDVRAAMCRLVALVPYPPDRWPVVLTKLISFVPWTEQTTARQVMRALREARTLEAQVAP